MINTTYANTETVQQKLNFRAIPAAVERFGNKIFLIDRNFEMRKVYFTHPRDLFRQNLHEKEGVQ